MITPPSSNADVRTLWRKVAECIDVLNALANMDAVVEGSVRMNGRLSVGSGSSTLEIKEHKEITN